MVGAEATNVTPGPDSSGDKTLCISSPNEGSLETTAGTRPRLHTSIERPILFGKVPSPMMARMALRVLHRKQAPTFFYPIQSSAHPALRLSSTPRMHPLPRALVPPPPPPARERPHSSYSIRPTLLPPKGLMLPAPPLPFRGPPLRLHHPPPPCFSSPLTPPRHPHVTPKGLFSSKP